LQKLSKEEISKIADVLEVVSTSPPVFNIACLILANAGKSAIKLMNTYLLILHEYKFNTLKLEL